ncbi:hypothetical protein OROHE_006506 [Orobanche hederae]
MPASSLSIAAAAIGTCSNCFLNSSSSTYHHHHPSVYPFPYKISLSSIFCASTVFDSVDFNEEETVSGVEEEENDVSRSADDGRLYVGNLPLTMTSAHLSEIFAKAGPVVSVEWDQEEYKRKAGEWENLNNLICDRVTKRSRGFAFVTMGTVEEAKEAIQLFDGAQIGGRTIKVNFPEVPRPSEREVMSLKIRSSYQDFLDSPYTIYAGNLSWGLTSQGLREAFADQRGVISAKVVYDRDSGRSRGYGFITFSSAGEVEFALNSMNGVGVEGRPLRLNLREQRAAASPPPSVENKYEYTLENSEMFGST